MAAAYQIREATDVDIDHLIAFTLQEAREAEGIELTREEVARGVRGAFERPPRARYWVAETSAGEVVANASIVTEWSNFHGGHYWWVQSLFILPAHRGGGLVGRLLDHLAREAQAGGALNLRLYAHRSNERALRVYRRLGFSDAPYLIMVKALDDLPVER
jgi:ribosomal protein S18 acetylase RimI-like enzyme